jgi:hypothetical protein
LLLNLEQRENGERLTWRQVVKVRVGRLPVSHKDLGGPKDGWPSHIISVHKVRRRPAVGYLAPCKETSKGRVVHERGFCERRAHGENGDGDLGLGFEEAITKK